MTEQYPYKCPEIGYNNNPVSQEVREIIERMLRFDEKSRISWEDL